MTIISDSYHGEQTKFSRTKVLEDQKSIKREILDQFDILIFDMDGVLWRTNKPIDGAAKALAMLTAMGKQIFFVTNNSFQSGPDYVAKMRRLGLGEFSESQIFCSSDAAALYLKQVNYKGKVYMIGPEALRAQLLTVEGIELIDGYDHRNRIVAPGEMADEDIDTSIGAVVMGFDPYINYYKIAYATAILTNNPDALFIVTNYDLLYPSETWKLPGTGAFISTLEKATGRIGTLVGKPSSVLLKEIERRYPHVDRARTCMIGDNLYTDISFAKGNGIGAVLVETGVHARADVLAAKGNSTVIPDFIIPSIASLTEVPAQE